MKVTRVDLVWDSYIENSLKSSTREKRGSGSRSRVLPSAQIPKKWSEFLRVDKNKAELFNLLSNIAVQIDANGKDILATNGENVLCSPASQTLDQLSPCTHEEADTRIIIHCFDAASKGHQKIIIRTVDTDVVIIAISFFHMLSVEELWIAFGTGSKLRYLPAHKYAVYLGEEKARSLLFLHAFSGCDTVSFFSGRGKRTVWDVWMSFDICHSVFTALLEDPFKLTDECFPVLERFVVLLYDCTSDKSKVCQNKDFIDEFSCMPGLHNMLLFSRQTTLEIVDKALYATKSFGSRFVCLIGSSRVLMIEKCGQ